MAYAARGSVLVRRKEYDLAIADLDTAIRLKPDFAGAYYTRGRAHQLLKQTAQARADYRQALVLDPEFTSARDALGRLK